jgi:Domain of unknown function (DUF4203)
MEIQAICIGVIGILFGLAAVFAGYRFFLFLLPFWGFLAGFAIGAQALQALFGNGFLADVTSWVVGLIVGILFAVLAYLFYIVGVAILAGSLGYALGAGIIYAISPNWNLIAFLVGVVVAIVVAALVILLNIQKWVVILITSIGGAGAIVAGFLIMFGMINVSDIGNNAVLSYWQDHWLWFAIGIAIAAAGFVAQARSTSQYNLEPPPNRI